MESLGLKEQIIMKDIRNIFRLKKREPNDNTIKDARNLSRQKRC